MKNKGIHDKINFTVFVAQDLSQNNSSILQIEINKIGRGLLYL